MEKTMVRGALSACAAAAISSSALAGAGLNGDSVNSSIQPSSLWASVPPSAVVGGGPEFSLNLVGTPFFSVDLDAFSIRLNYVNSGGLSMGAGEVYDLTSLDMDGGAPIVGFNLTTGGNITGFDASDISFTATSVQMILNGSQWQPGSFAQIDLIVPAPGALALLGLAGVAVPRRRRR